MNLFLPTPIKLIIGLGNPGADYEKMRHNAGAWFAEGLVTKTTPLVNDSKLFGRTLKTTLYHHDCRLFIPNTFMNDSGRAVNAILNYYKIPLDEMLIVHDEIDLPAGVAQLKKGGGHGGHNGLRDIILRVGRADFWRLRLGVGHPGDSKIVADYVLKAPTREEKEKIEFAIQKAKDVLPFLLEGDTQKAMRLLHSGERNGI